MPRRMRQFDFAVSEKRAVLTNNFGDFVRLCDKYASSEKEHYGVIFKTKCTMGTIIRRLRNLSGIVTAEQMKNLILFPEWLRCPGLIYETPSG